MVLYKNAEAKLLAPELAKAAFFVARRLDICCGRAYYKE